MQIRIFTIPVIAGDEETERMNVFLRSHKVLETTKSVITQGDMAFWTFCVTYIDNAKPDTQALFDKKDKIDYKAVLDEAAFNRFSTLRAVRKQLAEVDAVPAYAVFTDAELAELAKQENLSTTTMKLVSGIGLKKVEKYGERLMKLLEQQPAYSQQP